MKCESILECGTIWLWVMCYHGLFSLQVECILGPIALVGKDCFTSLACIFGPYVNYIIYNLELRQFTSRYDNWPQNSSSSTVRPPCFADFGRKNLRLKNRETGGTAKQGGSPYIHPLPKYTGLTGNIGHDNTLLHYKTPKHAFIYSVKLFYQSKYVLKTTEVH